MDFSKRYDAIVIGAGGTSRAAIYALQKLESVHDIFIHNRTIAKAEQLAQDFGAQVLNSDWRKHNNLIIIGTIPAEAQGDYEWVLKDCQGIVVDMAYLNGATRLLEQAEAHNFIVIRGIEVLLEQGYAQFELFTKMQAPRQSICETVMQRYLP
jgi:pentafunctional AROM polypeptide